MDKKAYIVRLENAMKGTYSKEYIDVCTKYASSLLDKDLPVIFDETHLYEILQLYAIKPDVYRKFHILGKRGKLRTICAPSRSLKLRQRWILDNILEKIPVSECCEGFRKDHSIYTNAKKHIGYEQMLNIDIKDFFPSIAEKTVIEIFHEIGYSRAAADELGAICCHDGCLPQGAPTSPYLANLACREMDRELLEFAQNHKLIYTRYADDMTFSGNVEMDKLIKGIVQIVYAHGFMVNTRKTRISTGNQRRLVTGIIVKKDGLAVPRNYKRKLRQEIHYCKQFGVANHLENTSSERKANFREYLYGKAYYIKMIEPKTGEQFLRELDEIQWQ
ncbi:MAG: retron St85 family RNA-directed DNA polymerase [Lachnospiraceae bacterium]|nr:retron St85 family RNA-directed DNA polymerase [Lachnospiraceae bacterium]